MYQSNEPDHHFYNVEDDKIEGEDFVDENDDIADDADDGQANSEDEIEGDDLMENMDQDYEQRPELDNYERVGIDDEGEVEELSYNQRLEVDNQLNKEDRYR